MTVSVLHAAPAHAQAWRWLEKLSGPGDFIGYEVSVKLFCNYDKLQDETEKQLLVTGLAGVSLPCIKKKAGKTSHVLAIGSEADIKTKGGGLVKIDLARRAYALGAALSYLRGKNDLPYAPSPDDPVDRTIQILVPELYFDHRLTSRTDWGVAVGLNVFLVPDAGNFTRASVEARATSKLFDLRRGPENSYIGTASLRLGVLWFIDQLTAQKFGAIGNYKTGAAGEVSPSVRFIFDFDRNPFKSN